MSVYTNDVDTLRQMISQSIPQLVSSAITIVSVFTSMCLMSWQLTIVTMLMVALMLFCSKKITAMSGKYFVAQQKDLGKVNGYIEEMMEGQKVVKVFTHEQKALDGFRQLNDKLKESAKSGQQLRQHHHARYRTAGQYQLRGLCSDRRGHGRWQCRRHDPGHRDGLPEPEQELQYAHQPGVHAGQQHHHGTGRCRAHLQDDG